MPEEVYKTVFYLPGSLPSYFMHSEPEFYTKGFKLVYKTTERGKSLLVLLHICKIHTTIYNK